MERIKDGRVMPSNASGFFGRVTDNYAVGGKIGAGLSGAKTVTLAVEKAITRMNGGERPEFLDSKIWQKLGPSFSAVAVHATLVSPVGAAMPDGMRQQVDNIVDYMEIGTGVELSEEVLTPILASLIEHFSELPNEALNAMKVVPGGKAEETVGGE